MIEILKAELERDEGRRRFAYLDTKNIITVGVGRNLEGNGLTDNEIDYLLNNDIERVISECRYLGYWYRLNDVRKRVVANMVFQLGINRFRGFVRMNEALYRHDYTRATVEMLDSKWAKIDTPQRAKRLAKLMLRGRDDI